MLILPFGGPIISSVSYVGDDLDEGRAIIAERGNFGIAAYRSTWQSPYGAGDGCLQGSKEPRQMPGNWCVLPYDTF